MANSEYTGSIAIEILSDLSLRDKNIIAQLDEIDVEFLAYVFDRYISEKAPGSDPTEGMEIMRRIWGELSESHRLGAVK